jgi:hypothetical protein
MGDAHGDEVETVKAERVDQTRAKLLEEFQRRYVERMLEKHGGNVRQAARARHFQLLESRTREP